MESGVVGTPQDAFAVYKYVIANLAEGKPVSDEDFDIAVGVGRTRKIKRPVRG